jgi:hypothetical protein
MPGRPGLGTGHNPLASGLRWTYDGEWRYLRSVIGEDYLHYKAISGKEKEGEFEIFYWRGQKRFRCNQTWPNGTPCAYDTFDYQDLLAHVGQPHGRPRSIKQKVISPIVDPAGQPIVREEFDSVEFKGE